MLNEELRAIIADALGLDPRAVVPSLRRGVEEAWDSFGHLRLITAIEQAFGIQFTMHEIESSATVADLANLLHAHGLDSTSR